MTTRTLLLAAAMSTAVFSPALATKAAAQTSGCTQLESSAGLRGAECGRLTIAQIAVIHTGRVGG